MKIAKTEKVISRLKALRQSGVTSEEVDTEDVLHIYSLLNRALRGAINRATPELSNYDEVSQREFERDTRKADANRGLLPLLHPAR